MLTIAIDVVVHSCLRGGDPPNLQNQGQCTEYSFTALTLKQLVADSALFCCVMAVVDEAHLMTRHEKTGLIYIKYTYSYFSALPSHFLVSHICLHYA